MVLPSMRGDDWWTSMPPREVGRVVAPHDVVADQGRGRLRAADAASPGRVVAGDDVAADHRRRLVETRHPTPGVGAEAAGPHAIGDREALEPRALILARHERHHRRLVGSVDRGHGRPGAADDGDALAAEIDVLEVRPRLDQHGVAIAGRVDAVLDPAERIARRPGAAGAAVVDVPGGLRERRRRDSERDEKTEKPANLDGMTAH